MRDQILVDLADLYAPAVQSWGIDLSDVTKHTEEMHVKIDWKDMSVPILGREDWIRLWKALKREAQKKKVTELIFACIGGHGRTGTALSIIAALSGQTKDCPVTFIRSKYCEKAVEAKAQIEYIEEITGIKVKAKVTPYVYTGAGEGYTGGSYTSGGYTPPLQKTGGGKKGGMSWDDVFCHCGAVLTPDGRCMGCYLDEVSCRCVNY